MTRTAAGTLTIALLVAVAVGERAGLEPGRIEGPVYTHEFLGLTYRAPAELQGMKPPKLLFVDDGSTLLAASVTAVVQKRDASFMAVLLSAKQVVPDTTAQSYLSSRYGAKNGVRLSGKPEKRVFGGCSGARAMSRVKIEKKNWRGSHYACIRNGYAVELAIFGSDEVIHFLWEQKATDIHFQ